VKVVYKTQMHYPIALKFGTLEGGIKTHADTKFDCNNINGDKVKQLFAKNNTKMLSLLQS